MDPATAAAAAGPAKDVGNAVIGPITNYAMYKLQRRDALRDYERQRRDNLADFEMANKYNSPQEQMNRLRQAGLNPHLVYGKGADMAAAQMRGANIDSPDTPKNMAPLKELAEIKASAAQRVQSQAQTDNIIADTKNKEIQAGLYQAQKNQTDVQTANIAQNTATSEFQLQQSKELKDSVIQKAKLENDALEIKNVVTLSENERAQLKSASDIEQAVQNIAESKQRVINMQLQNAMLPLQRQKLEQEIKNMQTILSKENLDVEIKKIELELRKKGISPNDPYYFRTVWSALQGDNYSADPYMIYQSERVKDKGPLPYKLPARQ